MNAAYAVLNSLKTDTKIGDLLGILNSLTIYEIGDKPPSTVLSPHIQISPNKLKLAKIKQDTRASLESLLRHVCRKFNDLWWKNYDSLDQVYRSLYSTFLSGDSSNNELFDLLCQVSYQVDSQLIVDSTYKDTTCPLLSIVKMYSCSSEPACQEHMWRRLFLFCCMEKKLLLKSLIVRFSPN